MGVEEYGRFRVAGDCIEMSVKKKRTTANVQLANSDEPDEVLPNQKFSMESEYTFRLNSTGSIDEDHGRSEDGPNQVEELAKQMEHLAMAHEKDEQKKLTEKHREKQTKSEEKHAKDQGLEQFESQNGTLKKQAEKFEKPEEQELVLATEYGRLLGAPNVDKLARNYKKEKLLQLMKHGSAIPLAHIYIQRNQQFNDRWIVQSVVDLLATVEKPEAVVGELVIERGGICDWFIWPQRWELKLKRKRANLNIIFNEASSKPSESTGRFMAEYELANGNCMFQVFLYYYREGHFKKWVQKFSYRRLLA